MTGQVDVERPPQPARGDGSRVGGTVTMAHGGGGSAMQKLIRDLLLPAFGSDVALMQEDQARLDLSAYPGRVAFTTDSFVVDPLFFPGGDIGQLAVHGTVNDLATGGARPLYLSCALILEEGLELDVLQRVAGSMGAAAREAGVRIVTGDTKVVARGAADRLFINTAGIGVIAPQVELSADRARPGDVVIVNGSVGDHGAAVLCARGDMVLDADVRSDTRPLNGLVETLLTACPEVRCMRDATRGGVVTVLNEIAACSAVGVMLEEAAVPVREAVRGVCELLGIDPLYLANEGKLVAVVPEARADAALAAMRAHPAGRESVVIGRVREGASRVTLRTALGGERLLDTLSGEQLPRIC